MLRLDQCTVITDEELFVRNHIAAYRSAKTKFLKRAYGDRLKQYIELRPEKEEYITNQIKKPKHEENDASDSRSVQSTTSRNSTTANPETKGNKDQENDSSSSGQATLF
jgi:hypothetical protein